jgi:hypothetical protein
MQSGRLFHCRGCVGVNGEEYVVSTPVGVLSGPTGLGICNNGESVHGLLDSALE